MASRKNPKTPPEAHGRAAEAPAAPGKELPAAPGKELPAAPGKEAAPASAADAAKIDPAASAALAEAVKSARQDLPSARAAQGEIVPGAAKSPSPRAFGSSLAAQALMGLALIGAGWGASYVGTLGNREAIARVEAETARSQEILARLNGDLEALKGAVASFRDVEQTASVSKASDQARLSEKVERLAVAVQDPGRKLSALETKLDRMESQIMAHLAGLAAKAAAPAPAPAPSPAPAAAPTPPAPSPAATEAREPAPAAKSARNEPLDGWVLREVYDGAALIEGNRRLYEVMPGGVIPGVGRVEAIERRGRNWVVLTDKGTISATR
jgi:hypothetical protein